MIDNFSNITVHNINHIIANVVIRIELFGVIVIYIGNWKGVCREMINIVIGKMTVGQYFLR